ncbi:hypothetical protein PG996_000053 [Apiospora saccharicola]|uniref:RGS domain-containing protein n=1 Tax=Apiospora saccharicola TaxID=335842 RepID=A0ABR1WCN2_9PEZI
MPFSDLDSMDGSIDEIHDSRRSMRPSQSQPRYKQMPRLDDEIDDDLFYNRSPPNKASATQAAAHTFLATDDMSEYGSAKPSGRGRSFSMDSMLPDVESRQFVPAYKKGHHIRESSDALPQFTEANLGFPNPAPTQPSSQRTSRRNSISDKKNDNTNGHGGRNNKRDDYEEAPRPLPTVPKRPREDEIEAARRILAAAEASSRQHEPSIRRDSGAAERAQERVPSPPATVRSATPPPIGRPRRYFTDETEPGPQQHHQPHNKEHGSMGGGTPEKIPARSSSKRPSSSSNKRHSVTSMSTMPSRAEPVLDKYQLDEDYEEEFRPLPPTRDYQSMSAHKRGGSHGGGAGGNNGNNVNININTTKARPPRRTYSDDEISVNRGGGGYAVSSHQSVAGSQNSRQHSRMPEFFSEEAFQTVLYNPITAHQLQKFSEQRLCGESVAFLAKVHQYQESLGGLGTELAHIHKSFISDSSTTQLQGVPRESLLSAHRDIKTTVSTTFTGMEALFADLQKRVEQTVFTDIYPRFVREKVSLSAIQALASDRHKYQGLGDCFCLSDPNKADNPIVFASDGFVKVTGYSRKEVVPRNCRFLQGPQTDRETVRNMKMSIDARKDTVELVLNYKKNGDPFWNLLYMAPLFDETGTLAFFIGGQVNCSTTIHSNTDVMKVLAGNSTPAAKEPELAPPQRRQIHRQSSMPSARKALLKAFGVRVDEARTLGESGMEDQVLGRMEGQDLTDQMKEFRTAYSKYLVVRADTFVIHFYSEGISEMLHPGNTAGLVTGQEVFRFFKANMVSKETDYRSRVRTAVRGGNPISVEIRLQTRRSALYRGDERFITHWTPLKDEHSATEWVVITLAPTMGL